MLGQLMGMARLTELLAIGGARIGGVGIGHQRNIDDLATGRRARADGQIAILIELVVQTVNQTQIDRYFGMQLHEFAEQRAEDAAGNRARRVDAQMTAYGFCRFGLGDLIVLRQQPLALRQQPPPVWCQ
ncbi:MAG: hypothetical protein B7Y88_08630 [Sphingomonadales bacterium 32-64-17]|nr:MAG: hypothetical protein B7Y88_08630 [Sphingomonadales bacterium 32-64-17]